MNVAQMTPIPSGKVAPLIISGVNLLYLRLGFNLGAARMPRARHVTPAFSDHYQKSESHRPFHNVKTNTAHLHHAIEIFASKPQTDLSGGVKNAQNVPLSL